jgi:exodeoxyribonuclease-1
MAASFFFYDLETSGINPRTSRIMQFAGQRTDLELKPVGEPVNLLIKLTPDALPEPEAIFVTGITPQQTLADGVTEAEFLQTFETEVNLPDTIFVGYNTIRFDDEFMRFLLYRNFYDPYEWQWKDGRSRWDLLDVVRMTRALRPDGIKWPVDKEGKPTNRLELLTALNGLDHENAHDALNDVQASIALAKLLRAKQPKLFDYLLGMRAKDKVKALVEADQPFVYSSGKYPAEFEKTTVAQLLCAHPKKQGALVYDLRHDPAEFLNMTAEQLAERWRYVKDSPDVRLPIKALQYNKCPAIAPLGVLTSDASAQKRLKIDLKTIRKHAQMLKTDSDFRDRVCQALDIVDGEFQQKLFAEEKIVDGQLYDGFAPDGDRKLLQEVRSAKPDDISPLNFRFHDKRLQALLPLYKARNYPAALTSEERTAWDEFCRKRLLDGEQNSRLAKYFERLQELATRKSLTDEQRYLLEELQLYGESIMPVGTD